MRSEPNETPGRRRLPPPSHRRAAPASVAFWILGICCISLTADEPVYPDINYNSNTRDSVNLYAGTDIVSMYASRGLIYSDRVSLQPWLEVDGPLFRETAGGLSGIRWFAGNWNSIQPGGAVEGEARTGREERLRDWFEADLYAGVRASFADYWTASLRFNYYTSPSDSFGDLHELDARLRFDDAHWWPDADGFALNPSARLTKTTRNRDGPNAWYLQAGIRPGGQLAGLPWGMHLEVPLIFGFGADGQYRTADQEHHFGFFQTGVNAAIPLDTWWDWRGSLRFSAGFDLIAVRDRELNLRGDRTTGIARAGLSYSY